MRQIEKSDRTRTQKSFLTKLPKLTLAKNFPMIFMLLPTYKSVLILPIPCHICNTHFFFLKAA